MEVSREVHVSCFNKKIPFCKTAQVTDSTLIRNTLETWGSMKKSWELRDDLMVMREIKEDPEFTPKTQDPAFNTWAQKGLTIFGQRLNENGTMSFTIYHIPTSSDIYK